jgi:hypothetical protein
MAQKDKEEAEERKRLTSTFKSTKKKKRNL